MIPSEVSRGEDLPRLARPPDHLVQRQLDDLGHPLPPFVRAWAEFGDGANGRRSVTTAGANSGRLDRGGSHRWLAYLPAFGVNRDLLWDYRWEREEMETEAFERWYVARVLTRGSGDDVRALGLARVGRWLPRPVPRSEDDRRG